MITELLKAQPNKNQIKNIYQIHNATNDPRIIERNDFSCS
jgi:hypothetical protein